MFLRKNLNVLLVSILAAALSLSLNALPSTVQAQAAEPQVSIDKEEVVPNEVFHLTLVAEFTIGQDVPWVTQIVFYDQIIGVHQETRDEVALCSRRSIKLEGPFHAGYVVKLEGVIPLRFPWEADPGDYDLLLEVVGAEVQPIWLQGIVDNYLPFQQELGLSVRLQPPPPPTIAFSPTSFTFGATEGEAGPPEQTLQVWNSGGGILDWSLSDDAAWLELNPTSGSATDEVDNVTVSVHTSGMDPGSYSTTITISAEEATNTPQTVSVSLTLETPPTIAFSPASFTFGATEGEADPADQTLEVWNSGCGILDWSLSDDATWLELAPTSSASGGDHEAVTVSLDISGMSAGDYDATIIISAEGASNSPQDVPVSLHISSVPAPTTKGLSAGAVAGIVAGSCAAAIAIYFAIRKWLWKRD